MSRETFGLKSLTNSLFKKKKKENPNLLGHFFFENSKLSILFFFFLKREFLPFQLRAIFKSHPKKKKSWLCFLNRWLGEQKQQGKVWLDFLYNLFISSEQKDSQSSAPHFLNQERKMPRVLDSLRSAKQSTEILPNWRGPGGTGRTSRSSSSLTR